MRKKLCTIGMLVLFVVCCFTAAMVSISPVSYGFIGKQNWGNTEEELEKLYNETNTYSGAKIEKRDESGRNDQYNISFDMSKKNGNRVSDVAKITVLTHGVGSKAADWSNDFDFNNPKSISFAYDKDSIIAKFAEKNKDATL